MDEQDTDAGAAIAYLTWPEFARRIENHAVVIPVGSVEQHGPHLPLGTDVFIPYQLALHLSGRLPLLVAPPLWYAASSDPGSGGGQRFPGTLAIRGTTLIALVTDILHDLIRQGASRIALFNGHFENTAFLAEASRQVLPVDDASGRKIVLVNWWEHVPDAILHELFPEGFPGWEVEHASLTETSLMLTLHPDVVHQERIPAEQAEPRRPPRHKVFPEPKALVPESGILYRATAAAAVRGEALLRVLVEEVGEVLRAEFRL